MITAVYGKVDAWDVVFNGYGDQWQCTIPPDFTDGQYACSFVAENDAGETGFWTGILYITGGNNLCPRLVQDDIVAWMLPDIEKTI